ncbi:ABC transporter permease [Propionibacteriaceae bacterium Y1923]|uniref:ABC transporter permease n=1 Tax=Aestuariimicrobium sp. Y1814 TaxID=3418742 RepID=UPI003C258EE0
MIRFLLRRLGLAIGILFVISFVAYGLLALALDPLSDLRESTALNKEQLIQRRIDMLRLDEHWTVRYWDWLTSVLRGDFGDAWMTGQKVNDMLGPAMMTSVQLVATATFLALIVGVIIGVVSALRQYTAFDYTITLISFVLYALPVFWVAVLLKEYLAIGLNNYLANPVPNWPALVITGVLSGLFWAGALGGDMRRRLITFGSAFLVTFGLLTLAIVTGWIKNPFLGIIGVGLAGLGLAYCVTLVFAGLKNRRALYSSLTMVAIGLALYYPLQYLFYHWRVVWRRELFWGLSEGSATLLGLLLVTIVVGCVVGWLFGGDDRGVSMRGAALTGVIIAALIYVDQVLKNWSPYFSHREIRGRPIATIGARTPAFDENYWLVTIDRWTHLLLPTMALVLISFAGYVRYERGATLEVLSQDYIRTARSKGLSERVVIVRHALRNALMPLASIIPVDIVSLLGGAVITETIFGWSGMGKFFIDHLGTNQIDPVMIYILFTGALAMLANLMADLLYGLLDPRIRVNA